MKCDVPTILAVVPAVQVSSFNSFFVNIADLAHLVEQRTRNAQVVGPSPTVGLNSAVHRKCTVFFYKRLKIRTN